MSINTFGSCSDDDAPAEITPNPDSEITLPEAWISLRIVAKRFFFYNQ